MKKLIMLFTFILAFSYTSIIASAAEEETETETGTEKEYLTDEMVDVLLEEDYALAYQKADLSADKLPEELTEQKMARILHALYVDRLKEEQANTDATASFSIMAVSDILPDAYKKLNSKEKSLAKKSPWQAGIVYNASEVATSLAGKNYKNGNADGGNGNAFKHAFWNAAMTREMGATKTKKWADAHEYGHSGVATDMDLKNNQIGRDTYAALAAKSFLKPGYAKIEKELISKVNNGKLYRVVNKKLVKTTSSDNK